MLHGKLRFVRLCCDTCSEQLYIADARQHRFGAKAATTARPSTTVAIVPCSVRCCSSWSRKVGFRLLLAPPHTLFMPLCLLTEQPLPKLLIFLCARLEDELGRTSDRLGVAHTLSQPADKDEYAQSIHCIGFTVTWLPFRCAAIRKALSSGDFTANPSLSCAYQLLKTFLRELPTTLIPEASYEPFLQVAEERLQAR